MRAIAVLGLLLLFSGCAGSSVSRPGGNSPNVITREEILEVGAANLWDVVNRIRPQWLQVNSNPTFGGGEATVLVYRDNVQLGGVEALRGINPEVATEMRWLNEMEASNRFSRAGASGRIAGAIVILTRTP